MTLPLITLAVEVLEALKCGEPLRGSLWLLVVAVQTPLSNEHRCVPLTWAIVLDVLLSSGPVPAWGK
eukprot:CAMPEP_0206288516 /NCGR_PEP_ID=MMETSP0106_2-20121207/1655_1 /ASSEMBLY_ACC=CAM_ASM_000206 /TAXON_ID=81532 /ORGANISM="Acanthoeca-like sp., Strain 10tr" /LENGTH=66 /DNA_ID=CAMNT_0053719069 /DNA_START=450 /DNA_END=650 /DNA_ORIENTATION=+